MNMRVVLCAAAGTAAVAGAAYAQVTQSYSYDGNGRLIGVITSGSSGTNTASYAYDDAHNRVQRVRSGTATYAAVHSLPDGGTLPPTEALVSPDGRFTFALRPTGHLELWREDDRLWSLEDLAGAPAVALSDAGAQLALGNQEAAEGPVWSVTNDGALIVSAGPGAATVWSSAGMH
jgi:hypothetical protein